MCDIMAAGAVSMIKPEKLIISLPYDLARMFMIILIHIQYVSTYLLTAELNLINFSAGSVNNWPDRKWMNNTVFS